MFKVSFKYYKSKKTPPSLEEVIDFENVSKWSPNLRRINSCLPATNETKFGLKNCETWEIFEIINNPGLIFIKNPFTPLGQRYWAVRCLRDYPFSPNKTNLQEIKFDLATNGKSELQLRWATLGYHHNWDTKVYSEDLKDDFPNDLAKLCRIVGEVLGFEDFKAQAAIVNYYYFNSTLSGHTDHSEDNLEAPLFSFSFGQSAIFLLGGRTIEEKPTPILIRSGDIVIMSEKSRLCYHGVPKILEDKNSKWENMDENELLEDENNVLSSCRDNNYWDKYSEFLSKSRINMNVRQVLRKSQLTLKCTNLTSIKRRHSGDLHDSNNARKK